MSFKSAWGFDPDESPYKALIALQVLPQTLVMKAQPFVPHEPDVFESAYEADEERAAGIPPDINSQIYELRRMFRL